MKPPAPMPSPASRSPSIFSEGTLTWRRSQPAFPFPVLRKDFTVDEYMIYQAAAHGASAVLLICSILEDKKLLAYRQLADELKLSALVEAHSEEEISRAVKAGARIIGVNNRNLKNFQVDVSNSLKAPLPGPEGLPFRLRKRHQNPLLTSKSWRPTEPTPSSSERLSCEPRTKKPCWTRLRGV